MRYGQLTVVAGPMFAGKTTQVLDWIMTAHATGRSVRIFKPEMDTRYATDSVVNHDGVGHAAESVAILPVIDWSPSALVILDEVQFYAGDPVEWVRNALAQGVDVCAAGLDMDWQGKPFATTASLLSMADVVLKRSARCAICDNAARKTFKKSLSGGSVEIGGSDVYEPRCNAHWI
jgi:thymidine kinase